MRISAAAKASLVHSNLLFILSMYRFATIEKHCKIMVSQNLLKLISQYSLIGAAA